jgi:NDP-sugar pyrophosphorylase family protein
MILAAGLGTRLRPLTDRAPKPLLPIAGRPLLHYTLAWIASAGIRQVMINLHHMGEMIRDAIGDGRGFGLEVSYSEEPDILGTGGGLKRVERFFADGPFLVVNADILTTVDPRAVIAAHAARRGLATLVVREDPEVATYGAIGLDPEDGSAASSAAGVDRPGAAGRHVHRHPRRGPRVLRDVPAGVFSPITDAYIAQVERGDPLFGYRTDAF